MAVRVVQPQAVAGTVRPSGAPARTGGRYAGVLALQRSIGNAATRRLLARSPRKPYQHQWENPDLVATIYPAREAMLRKFVTMYREIELADIKDPEERKAAAARLKEGTDALKDDALMAEVKRLLATKGAPEWLGPLVLDYAGMRYKSAHGSYYSPVRLVYFYEQAKGTWASEAAKENAAQDAAHDAKVAEWEAADPKKRGKKPAKPKAIKTSTAEKAAPGMAADAAVAKLEALHDAGQIPEWAWHKIVRLTELRIWYAGTDWEDTAAEKPTGTPQDAVWVKALADWTGDKAVGGLGYGITGWRREIQRRNALVTTRMVCNELSEATQRSRGISLQGGISKNARQYIGSAGTPGAYFKRPSSPDDFKPGAALFWIDDTRWEAKEPDDSNKVYGIPGVTEYPMPITPEYISAWTAWDKSDAGKAYKKSDAEYKKAQKAYDAKVVKDKAAAKKLKVEYDPATSGTAPVKPVSDAPEYLEGKVLPRDGEVSNGWTYTVKAGQPITRSKDGVTHWMRWRHQATVLKAMPGNRIFTFETTDALAGSAHLGVSGFAERSLGSLSKPGVFVGYLPNADEVAAARAAAADEETDPFASPVDMIKWALDL